MESLIMFECSNTAKGQCAALIRLCLHGFVEIVTDWHYMSALLCFPPQSFTTACVGIGNS
ncbi:hypothetical protein CY34DRAFT_803464, partial [Suillus luteus UH-Slu-Lm8-n1]